ncbi:Uma2 family endonuclease [Leptolyngbya sp. NIES-2104]|uniref:Uma2 family endonuclease n=1 Tax=Leptolyngbya sp. NIES-2104 TaxID=1552121 RepID=UPI0006EC8251|nr:Uma2 family endonuclease [Leptolyngbya sp. NIES-2104]GAP97057.1 predicted dioxygenase [Leptolyngbya sp. NIES-2104]
MKTLAKWSIDEYHRMIEAGILRDRCVELLAGEIVEMSPETPLHYSTAKRGARYLERLLDRRAEVRFNGPITLTDSEPEPDIAIVCLPEEQYRDRHPNAEDIYLLIEVAKTSLKKDTDLKAGIYATAGIQEYWVLNLAARRIIVFRDPQNGKYQTEQVLSSGAIAPLEFPDLSISIDRLLADV